MFDDFPTHPGNELDPRDLRAPLDLTVVASVIRALERDLVRVPGLRHAASALALAALEVEQQQQPRPLIASILKRRFVPRGRRN